MVGTPQQIADKMELWFRNDGADGFNLMPPSQPESINDFVELVVPILQQRGLFRYDYTSDNLHEHLGLAIPK
jgi:alkanesulfonate monooxygenase SsuD/methylene tetrahydromethanopterin reductase-like flavin-dependent oxidoreductase (luciferase family)